MHKQNRTEMSNGAELILATKQSVRDAAQHAVLGKENNVGPCSPNVDKDNFGLPPYEPLYKDDAMTTIELVRGQYRRAYQDPEGTSLSQRDSVIPWELQQNSSQWTVCRFLATPAFWKYVERALRSAVVGVLPAAVLLHATFQGGPWVSQSFLVSGALLATKCETIGQMINYVGQLIRSSAVWVCLLTVEIALELYKYPGAWFPYYFFSCCLIATFMDGYSRRLGLLLFTASTMSMLRAQAEDEILPLNVFREYLIGAGLAFFSVILPWPVLSTQRADDEVTKLNKLISTSLLGLTASFWPESNLKRNIHMVRLRNLTKLIEESIGTLKTQIEDTSYEWMFEVHSRQKLRLCKFQLAVDLYRNINSIRRVIEIVRDRPQLLEHSARSALFGKRLGTRIDAICTAVGHALRLVSESHCRKEIIQSPLFDYIDTLRNQLQSDFHHARREYFYEAEITTIEDFVPMMTFYVFCVEQICFTMLKLRDTVRKDFHKKTPHWFENLNFLWMHLVSPLLETYERAKSLLFRRSDDDVRIVIEAVKVSAAMVASLGFYFYMDEGSAFFTGPTIIAFLAANNPAEAVISAVPRLTGTLIGVVIGFFISTTADTSVSRVAGLVSFIFICKLVLHVRNIGQSLSYAAFISISQIGVNPLTKDQTINRIQQATFAVFIYVLITMFVLPCRPTVLLRQKRAKAILAMSEVFHDVMNVFCDTGDAFEALASSSATSPLAAQTHEPFVHSDTRQPSSGNDDLYVAGGSILNTTVALRMSIASFVEFPAEAFEEIEKKMKVLDKAVLAARLLMPFAIDEPKMTTQSYPSRACDDMQTALAKAVALTRTMVLSVRTLRERRVPPTREMIALFRSLVPVIRDSVQELRRFSFLIASLVEQRRVDLTPEVMKSSESFSRICSVLYHRKSLIFLACIKNAIAPFRTTTTFPDSDPPSDAMKQNSESANISTPITGPQREGQEEALLQAVAGGSFTASFNDGDSATGPSWRAADEDNSPQLTLEPKSALKLPENFRIPVTVQDAEGVHSLTFCVLLFAAEMRKFLIATEDSLQRYSRP